MVFSKILCIFLRRYQSMAFDPRIKIDSFPQDFNIQRLLIYSLYNSHVKMSWFHLEDKRNCFKWFILLFKRQKRPQDTD